MALFDAQAQSRHLDFAARWLRAREQGHYTIGSAGHESNAAVAMALRLSDPALLHYRSGGFYAARAAQRPAATPIRDVLLSLTSAADDPISRGRHKVFGSADLSIVPQTSTIGSHLPRAVGLAFGLDRRARAPLVASTMPRRDWPTDAVVVCSFGDASANHSTSVGALNAARYLAHRGVPLPLLFVCEDNGIGISTRTPSGWTELALSAPGLRYRTAEGDDPIGCLQTATELLGWIRRTRRPGVLHLRTVRFLGHAGSDAEQAYRSRAEIVADYARDPLLATARVLVHTGVLDAQQVLSRYERIRTEVMDEAAGLLEVTRLRTAEQVIEPLVGHDPAGVAVVARGGSLLAEPRLDGAPQGEAPAPSTERVTLAQSINAALVDVMREHPQTLLFGEDVAVKGGVYGVTRGLRRRFGPARVFDTLLDEQTILGTAAGSALAGYLPIPEIQYLAYLHNAEDQLRGEAASLRFFSAGQYSNGMVVRIAGLAYQKGFGGHFHNDNAVAVLRDIPGIVVAVPAHPGDAPGLLRSCVAMAAAEGRVCVYLEPIARYHTRDLFDGDGAWTATPTPWEAPGDGLGSTRRHGTGGDLLMVTFGNGVHLGRRAMARLSELGVEASLLDLRWLVPLPVEQLTRLAADFDRVLVVDETRHAAGVGEGVISALVEAGYRGRIGRVASRDSYIPIGPAADLVLLGEDEIVTAARKLTDVD